MPKVIGTENGSEPKNLLKIPKGSIWPNLEIRINSSVDLSPQMKKSVRPLFSILLFIVFAATLSFRAVIHAGGGGGGLFFSSSELHKRVPVRNPAPVFNSTLLKHAASDIAEEKTKKEIEQLLERNFDGNRGRYRTFATWRRFHHDIRTTPSSGMQAVMLALGICDEVSMFGFGKSASAKHHYHTNQKAELHLHDYEAEYRFYRDLVENPRAIPFISDKFNIPPVKIYH